MLKILINPQLNYYNLAYLLGINWLSESVYHYKFQEEYQDMISANMREVRGSRTTF